MKKLFFTFIAILLPIISCQAYVQIDGIYYNLDSQTMTAEVTYGPAHFTTLYPGDHEYVRDYYYLGDIVIPESVIYEGVRYSVTTIVGMNSYCDNECVRFPGAFENCSGLTSVTFPSSVSFIGSSAFGGCSGLKKVIVNDIAAWCGIQFEDFWANPLYYAKHLYSDEETIVTDLVIPSDVTSISSYTFYNCSDITSITIPSSVSSMGQDVFENTPWLDSQPDGLVYAGMVAYKYKGTMPSNTSIVIKDGTKGIAGGAFSSCAGLTSVIIPNSVTSIGDHAFNGCAGLTTMDIPGTVSFIGDNAFQGCTGLTSIVIPNSVNTISDFAFKGCSGLTSVTIPNSVTTIGNSAFYNCSGLTMMNIPDSVTFIGDYAFRGCSGLTTLVIPSSVVSIGRSIFDGCNNLTTLTINAKVIGNWFSSCRKESIKELLLGEEVISIGNHAFSYFSGLTTIILPNNLLSIGSYAFRGCSGLTSVYIPNSVSTIDSYAFGGCSGLTSIDIPKSVVFIGNNAFQDCGSLTSVSLYCSSNSLGKDVFDKCENVMEMTLDWDTITSIPFPITNINKVVLTENVNLISERTFANIDKLNDVYCYSIEAPKADRTSFENSYVDYVTLHVPVGSIDKYKSTAPWSGFKEIVAIEGTEPQDKCATPTIDYKDGKLVLECETDGAECVTTITSADVDTHYGNEVAISYTYNISTYAKAEGHANSEVVNAMLIWIEMDETTTALNKKIEAKAVLVQTHDGTIRISGAELGTMIEVYNVAGTQIANVKAQQETTQIATTLNPGDIAIVKIGKRTVKVVMR